MTNININPEWMDQAKCADGTYDPDTWFPEWGDFHGASKAKTICNTACPVLAQCREYALHYPVLLKGVWGGMNYREVHALRVKKGITTITESGYLNG